MRNSAITISQAFILPCHMNTCGFLSDQTNDCYGTLESFYLITFSLSNSPYSVNKTFHFSLYFTFDSINTFSLYQKLSQNSPHFNCFNV
uniref:Uncharacterized protein n=1 Tax=Staphylococcus arlettae TaxID=29378 RepID=A0A1W5QCD1_9STAP|nr:hypothetical protein [Staphylococcus arlettae]